MPRPRRPDPDRLAAMRDALRHRGPDDAGIEILDNVGLVHTRLSIVDLSERGHQPMSRPGNDWSIVYNGEIYNHLALRADLAGTSFEGGSDTETLLWGLQRWGTDVLPRLTGQFAFAAVDPGQERLVLARDRWGIKPLYLAHLDGGLWFASEPEALVAAGVPAVPVPGAWESIEAGSFLGGETTLLQGITRLPIGSLAEISLVDGTATARRWHDPTRDVDPVRAAALARKSRTRLTDELERTLRHAVHGSLLADATVGTLCSGGLDSSLITALAVERMPGIVAFGAGYPPDGRLDEGPAAVRVAKELGIEVELVQVTPHDFRRLFVPATVHFGSPIANASAVTVAQLAERAEQCGVKVLLTGEGSDELFGGYDSMHAATLAAFLPRRARVIRNAEPLLLSNPWRVLDPTRVVRKLSGMARHALGQAPAVSAWNSVLDADTQGSGLDDATAAYSHHQGERQELEADLLHRLDYSLCWLLNRMDTNVMQMSVEARVPFLEPEVVDLALNLPLEARVGPWSKGILRDVARRVLPWSIAHRPKLYGMAFNAGAWVEAGADPDFLRHGRLRETLGIATDDWNRLIDGGDGALRLRLWSSEVWCRSIFGRQSVQQIEHDLWREDPSHAAAGRHGELVTT